MFFELILCKKDYIFHLFFEYELLLFSKFFRISDIFSSLVFLNLKSISSKEELTSSAGEEGNLVLGSNIAGLFLKVCDAMIFQGVV